MPEKRPKKDPEAEVLDRIATWPEPYAEIGRRMHDVILAAVPELRPKLWYGMPGYHRGGPVLCFFRVDETMSFGLTEKASTSVEPGAVDKLMASAWFLTELDAATEERVAAIVRAAAG
jgi:hypothetical protein